MPTQRLRPHALALVIRRSLRLAAPMAVGLAGLPAIAQAQQVQFNVPAQPLASALLAFGSQSNLQVLYSPQDVEGKRSSALTGAMEPAAALSRLLQGTGVSYQIQGNQVTIHTREGGAAVELGATNIDGKGLGQTTENTGSYTTGSMQTATKLPLTLRETPPV